MCKNNSVSQHVLKYTVLILSWFPGNTNGIACNILISFFIEHKRSRSHYNLGLSLNLGLADKAFPDAGSLLTPVRANQVPLLKASAKV